MHLAVIMLSTMTMIIAQHNDNDNNIKVFCSVDNAFKWNDKNVLANEA